MTTEEIINLINQKSQEGKIVFYTIEGLAEAKMENIIQQPGEGLLYDLNRDMMTLLSRASEDNPCWVNDIALASVTRYLIDKVNEITGDRDRWKLRCEELERKKETPDD